MDLQEKKVNKWSGKVKEKEGIFPKGFFTQSAEKIAKGIKSRSDSLKQSMSRLNFFINREGKNLSVSDKKRLEKAKEKLHKLYTKKEGVTYMNADKYLTEKFESLGVIKESKIVNINDKWGDPIEFDSVEEMEDAIRKSGYDIPEGGLKVGVDYEEILESNSEVMYADVINGKFDMTRDDLIQQIKDNPYFTNPEDICFVDTDGVEYTGYDALEMANVENELAEKFESLGVIKENYKVEVVWKYEGDHKDNSDHLAILDVESNPESISDATWINMLYKTQDNISDRKKISIEDVRWDDELEENEVVEEGMYKGLNSRQMSLIKAYVKAHPDTIQIDDIPNADEIYDLNPHELFWQAASRYIGDLKFDESAIEEKKLSPAEVEALKDSDEESDEVEKIVRPKGTLRKGEVHQEGIQYNQRFLDNAERWVSTDIL